MSEISFVDTTLRDGQQSLWALGMKTDAMLGAAAQMDRIGFESMEFFVSIMIKKYVRELKENPWDWVREGAKRFRHTRLRNHGGLHGSGAMEKLPHAALKLLAERVVSYGITLTRTSNCWNDFEAMRDEVRELRAIGMETVVNLIYSVSPRHTDEYYAQKAREAAAIAPYRICFKDVGGLLTPERARTLLPAILHERRRRSGGISRPLQQRSGDALLYRGGEARHHFAAHGGAAARQRLVATIYFECREKSARPRLHAGGA